MGSPKASLITPAQPPSFNDPQSIFDLLNFVMHELLGVSGAVVTRMCENEYGITREEWQCVAMLAKLGDMSPSDLAARTTVDRSQISKTLRVLMAKDLIKRHKVAGDGRRARVQLSPQGQALYEDLFPRVVHVHHEVLQDLTPSQRRTLAQGLVKMQGRAWQVAQQHKVGALSSRRQGGSRTTWRKTKGVAA